MKPPRREGCEGQKGHGRRFQRDQPGPGHGPALVWPQEGHRLSPPGPPTRGCPSEAEPRARFAFTLPKAGASRRHGAAPAPLRRVTPSHRLPTSRNSDLRENCGSGECFCPPSEGRGGGGGWSFQPWAGLGVRETRGKRPLWERRSLLSPSAVVFLSFPWKRGHSRTSQMGTEGNDPLRTPPPR